MKLRRDRVSQQRFAMAEFWQRGPVTQREKLLGETNQVVQFAELEALIEPHYATSGRVARPLMGVALMLRLYFLQQRLGLRNDGIENAIYDSQSMRNFVKRLCRDVRDAIRLLKFRGVRESTRFVLAGCAIIR